jgi:hypothetical protein
MSFQFNNLAQELFSFMMRQLQRQWKQGTVLITMLLYHVLHTAHNSVRAQYAAQGLEPECN